MRHNFAARHVVVLGNVTKDRLGPCQGSNERKVMGYAYGFVCSPKWSDLLQVKTKMFQYRGGFACCVSHCRFHGVCFRSVKVVFDIISPVILSVSVISIAFSVPHILRFAQISDAVTAIQCDWTRGR